MKSYVKSLNGWSKKQQQTIHSCDLERYLNCLMQQINGQNELYLALFWLVVETLAVGSK